MHGYNTTVELTQGLVSAGIYSIELYILLQ